LKSTAIYPNRIKDKKFVESELGLSEFGDDSTEFFTSKFTKIFKGYSRIVYGDHGPYVEFLEEHLLGNVVNKFSTMTPPDSYYEWRTVRDGSDVKIYFQLRDVKLLKNPPKGGRRGNRKEGYADYVPGRFYINPFELLFRPNLKILKKALDKLDVLAYLSKTLLERLRKCFGS
jgi:hypothetical protein